MDQLCFGSQIKFDGGKVQLNEIPVKSNFTDFMTETFGKWLERKREAAGLNQTELAARSRVTKATISLYEQDKVEQPRLKQLDKIALALGISKEEVRRAAGQAKQTTDPLIQDLIDAARVKPKDFDYNEDERAEFREEMEFQIARALERIQARRKRDLTED